MLLRTFSSTLQLNPTLELYLTLYWDRRTHPEDVRPEEPLIQPLGRQLMLVRVNEALERWKAVAQLGGSRFTLESMIDRLIKDDALGACRIVVQDSNGQGAETFHPVRYKDFLGIPLPLVNVLRKSAPDQSGPDYGTPDTPA